MEIIKYSASDNYDLSASITTIGTFDGIHLGHKLLFETLDIEKGNLKKMVITFLKNPDYSLLKRENVGELITIDDKIAFFERQNIDYLVLLDEEVLKYPYNKFNDDVLKKLNVISVVVGNEFEYGLNKKGNINTLGEDFNLYVCPVLTKNGDKLSSNNVRKFLLGGEVEKVQDILGTNYKISGIVQKGASLGAKFGFPTANINIPVNSFKLLNGVYACYIYIDENKYLGVVNVGINPTVNTQKFPRIEAHVIDFKGDLYGRKITVEFLKMLRREKKFDNTDELIKVVLNDIEYVKKGFNL